MVGLEEKGRPAVPSINIAGAYRTYLHDHDNSGLGIFFACC